MGTSGAGQVGASGSAGANGSGQVGTGGTLSTQNASDVGATSGTTPNAATPGGSGEIPNGTTTTGNGASRLGTTPTNYGGQSSSHISTQGQMNTNGPNATGRTYGTSRASLRHTMHHKSSHLHAVSHTSTHHHHHLHTTAASYGGRSSSHIGTQGQLNTNGPNATTQTYGTDRANLRSNGAVGTPSQPMSTPQTGTTPH
jgi:hypothetical protein